jgi:hypothetical protein
MRSGPAQVFLAFLAFIFASLGTCCVAAIIQANGLTNNEYAPVQKGIASLLLPVWILAFGLVIWLLLKKSGGDL